MAVDYHQVKELFQSALEHDANSRSAFLDSVCNGDYALRREVEVMLAYHDEAEGFIEAPAFAIAAELIAHDEIEIIEGKRIGPYKIIREIGRGGMGAVYLAERDDDQYQRQVAIKVIKRGMDTDFIVQRFRNERQILANLEHSNIARLLEGGATADGLPYFVMEYIEGQPIDKYCQSKQLTTRERLELFRQVCAAVHYAHQNLVIHRDLKPGNILITTDGALKLLDFGIAKLLNSESSSQTIDQTATVLRMMTPDYASPEQVKGETITTASDVYSLGVLLYELLCGQRPYRIKSKAPDEIVRLISEQEPEKPSAAGKRQKAESTTSDANRQSPIANRQLKGDLDNIVLMAMRKEPQRRYSSVAQFSDDIKRHLDGEPVIARKDTFIYRSGKFVTRHQAGVAAAAIFALLLIVSVSGIVWQSRVAARSAHLAAEERDRERLETLKAERINSFLQDILFYATPGPGRAKSTDVKVVEAVDATASRIDTELNDQPAVEADLHLTIARVYNSLRLFDKAQHHAEAAVKLRREIYGEPHPKVAEALGVLGAVFMIKGDYATASGYFEKAVPMQRALSGGDPVMLASLVRSYAAVQRLSGNVQASIPLYQEALELYRKQYGEDHELVATLYNDLACAHYDQDDFDEAINMDERSLAIFRKLNSASPVLAQTLAVFGEILLEKGEYKRAENAVREALDLRKQALGENHPDVANSLADLGWLAFLQHDLRAAEADENQALAIYRNYFPEMNMLGAAAPLENLGRIDLRTARAVRAENYLREALQIKSGLLPEHNWMVAEDESLLGECLTMQKRYAEAESSLLESYNDLQASRGENHHLSVEARNRLVRLYTAWGKPESAAHYR
jgi:serine/threonine-protein kinase